METVNYVSVVLAVVVVAATAWLWRVMNWVWFKPKRLESCLRSQGFDGRPYRFLNGDMKEAFGMLKEAQTKELDFADDPALRVIPFPYHVAKTFGKKSFIWVGPTPRVNIMNPEDIKEVMTKIDEYQKPKTLFRLLATGILSYNGEKWEQHRRILNPAFHQEKLKLMVPVFYSSCKEIVDEWERVVKSEGSGSCELDVWPHLQTMTCDVISRTAFGSSYQEGKRIFELLREMATLMMQMARQIYIPGWRFVPTKLNTRMKQAQKEIQGSMQRIIKKREQATRMGETNNDLLGLLLESNNNNNGMMTVEDVIEECKLFYFAGQETTSTLLVWTMILLSKYPVWQERARREVLQVFGTDADVSATMFDSNALNKLKTITMILDEVLRLYPPATELIRVIEKDTKMGDVVLPTGIQVGMPMILVHKDPEIWGSDAGEFNPGRFADGVSRATKNQQQGAYFPFGWGPRICIGMNFAFIEAKMALAIILKRFSFELSTSYVHAPSMETSILQPQFGARLILHQL